ncbi:hypothetical protein N9U60_01260 [Betaproteobacteria bacterium]|nr:hypothetical protein [Betaproteobacteria bacterium]
MFLFLLTSFCIFSGIAIYLYRIWGSSYTFSLVSVTIISALMYSMVGSLSETAMDVSFSAKKSLLTESLFGNALITNHATDISGLNEYIQSLEKDLSVDNTDINKWVLLARSQMKKQDFKKASEAYEEALKILPEQTDLMTELADSLAMIDDGNLNGKPMKLIARVLELEPTHQKALALAATNAMNNTEIGNAIDYWTRLKNTLPANSDDGKKISTIIRALKGDSPPESNISSKKKPGGKVLEGKLSIDKNLFSSIQKSLSRKSAIFLIVKEKNELKVPIAVKRISFEQFNESLMKRKFINFKVSDVHSMRTEVKLSDFVEVIVSARLSLSGQVKPQAGDLITNISLVKSDEKFVKLRFLENADN